MDTLRVRAYNVLFGDAFLISIPDRGPDGTVRMGHILVDVGNMPKKGESKDADLTRVFEPVLENVLDVLDGQPLDLYILTHEHMDHVRGLLFAESKVWTAGEHALRDKLDVRHVWLTASAADDYYERFREAGERRLAFTETYKGIDGYLSALAASPEEVPGFVEAMWLNNNLWMGNPRSTEDCVDYVQALNENKRRVSYVHRGFNLRRRWPFHEARVELWAPEEDTSVYYGPFRPMALGMMPGEESGAAPTVPLNVPPSGVDAGAFYNLTSMRRGYVENLLAIDKAANNTSVVFCLEWRGWRLLFTADAEERSWKEMHRQGVLKPVHLLKVSHHGSHNGTPDTDLLDIVLPPQPHDGKPRYALVSTYEDVYGGVPDDVSTLALIKGRCNRVYDTRVDTSGPGRYVDVKFRG
jgi:beta-lactamase superfamily II metal-dependent hydrolase